MVTCFVRASDEGDNFYKNTQLILSSFNKVKLNRRIQR